MDTLATHFVADFYDVENPALLDDMSYCVTAVKEAIKIAGCSILNLYEHKFQPQGISLNATLSESHCAIHTWPEKGYCAIDLYGCGKHVDLRAGIDHLVKKFRPRRHKITRIVRGDQV